MASNLASAKPSIALVGAGLMGSGLARLFCGVDWRVAAWDRDAEALRRLCGQIPGVRAGVDLRDAVRDADLVIEAVAENAVVKQSVFAQLGQLAPDTALLATNSSVIPVGVVADGVSGPIAARVLGTHFWNPPDLIPLVEVIQGPGTAPSSIERAMRLLRDAGREPVHVRHDVVPGNRLQHALWREAIALVDEGVCSAAEVDRIVKMSFGARLGVLGPLENADLIGLELTAQIHAVVFPTLSRATVPSAGLQHRIDAGHVGVASGRGFYDDWTPDTVAALRARLAQHLRQWFRSKTG